MSIEHVLKARLVTRPSPTPTTIAPDMWWELAVDDGVEGAGPAGAASFTLPGSRATVWSDYAEPATLLRVDVAAALRPDDLGLIERVFGSAAAEALVTTKERSLTVRLAEQSSWDVAGRIALAHTLLDERTEPLSGLWALEVAELLAQFDAGGACDDYRRMLLDIAIPAIEALPTSLADRARDTLAPLGHLLQVTSTREDRALGPLVEALQTVNVATVMDAMRNAVESVDDAGPRRQSEMTFAPVRGVSDTPRVAVRIDHTIDAVVNSATGVLDRDRLMVRIELAVQPAGLPNAVRHIDLLVTAANQVIAFGSAFSAAPGGLAATVEVPASARGTTLDVVIGRNLPCQPMSEMTFAERAATHAGRTLADALRRESGDASRNAARSSWSAAGRPDLVRAVDQLRPARPFVVELVGPLLDITRDLDDFAPARRAGTPRKLAAARDLAWSIGQVSEAARLELELLATAEDPDLTSAELDALIIALFMHDPDAGRRLDALAS